MKIRWVWLILGAVVAEAATILLLILLVAIFGPREAREAEIYAEKLGLWVGPIGGAMCSFLIAFLIARRSDRPLAHGALLGCFHALVDVALLVAMRAPFEWIFVASDAGKIIAGILGGLAAARSFNRPA